MVGKQTGGTKICILMPMLVCSATSIPVNQRKKLNSWHGKEIFLPFQKCWT